MTNEESIMRWKMRLSGSRGQRRSLAAALMALALAGCAGQTVAPRATVTPVAADARLAGQLVYVSVGTGAGITTPGIVEALNAQTGALVWKAQTVTTSGEPVVANGTLFVAADDGTVRAFDATTGAPRWSFTRTVGVSSQLGLDGYVAVSGDTVFVTSDGGAVYALDAATGKQRWLYTLPTPQTNIYTTPTLAFGMVYFGSGGFGGAVYALDMTTGKVRWTAAQDGGFDGQLATVGDTLYAGANDADTVHAYDAKTGASRWSFNTGAQVHARPAVGADTVYVGAQDSTVYAIHTSDQSLAWKFQTGGNAPTPLIATGAAPTLDGQTLYVGSQGGVVYALDTATGKPHWQIALNSPIDSPPTLRDDTLFVTTETGDVVALRPSDGASIWRAKSGGFIIAAPLVTSPTGAGA
jgi:eukaryotic-like serine/threonine-protein kinase